MWHCSKTDKDLLNIYFLNHKMNSIASILLKTFHSYFYIGGSGEVLLSTSLGNGPLTQHHSFLTYKKESIVMFT